MNVKYENGRLAISTKDIGRGSRTIISFGVDSETNHVFLMERSDEYPVTELDIKELSRVIAALLDMRVALKQDGGYSTKDYE